MKMEKKLSPLFVNLTMHASAMLMNFLRHAASLTILLRCLHDNLSSPGVEITMYGLIRKIGVP